MIAGRALLNTSLLNDASPSIQTQVTRVLLNDTSYMLTAQKLAAAGDSFFAIVELGARLCGSSARFESGTKGFFVANSKSGPFTLPPFTKELEASRKHMALFEGGVGGRRCLYHATIAPGPPPRPLNELPATDATTPSEAPEPTTSPNATVSSTPSAKPSTAPSPPQPSAPEVREPGNVFGDVANSSTNSTGRVCFPASARVDLRSGPSVRMDELSIGDEVHVGQGKYSTVFMFTHKDGAASHRFVRIIGASGHKLEATAGHFVYLDGRLQHAQDAKVGQTLVLADGTHTVVNAVESVEKRGLYNPQTLHGDIVVNGVLASTYTSAVHPATPTRFLLRSAPPAVSSTP